MKTIFLAFAFLTVQAYAQVWTETYKLPEGTTFRARTAGYDCGRFITSTESYVATPEVLSSRRIEFKQLSADKDLNKFLFEAEFPSSNGEICIYGIFLDRNRETKTLDFTHSLITTIDMPEACAETKEFLDTQLKSVQYEGSKRGLRYVAVQVIKDTTNEVCESNNVRVVFDRRYEGSFQENP